MNAETESLFYRVFHSNFLAICIATLDGGRMIAFNKSYVELLGYPEDVLVHSTTLQLGIWHDPNERYQLISILLEQGHYEGLEAQLVRADGQVRDTVMTMELLDLEVGRCILTFARDVTEQRRAERSLRESEERFRQSFTFASIGKAIVGLDGHWIEVNPALCDLLGYSEEELLQLTFQDITHPDDLAAEMEQVQQMIAGAIQTYHLEKRYFHRQGQEVWVLLSMSLVHDGAGLPLYFLAEVQSITDRKRYEQQLAQQQLALEDANARLEAANIQLERLANTDSLTELKNRRAFDEHLNREVERAARQHTPLSLLLLDVDHFKAFNDAFGHPAGDMVLRQVAQLIQVQCRSIDIPARHGGEEFMVIAPGTNQAEAVALAERLRRALESFSWLVRAVTVSIGVATWMPTGMCIGRALPVRDELVSQADRALYKAKSTGRNRVVHAD